MRKRLSRIAALILGASGAVTLAVAACAQSSAVDGGPVVQTRDGKVQGFFTSGVAEFLGIPYAAPPVGDLRWRPPVPAAPWKAVLKATAFGPTCAQNTNLGPFSGPASVAEDCLFINVFTPNLTPDIKGKGTLENLPVMFWSYGGGESVGESNDYDGSKLAREGNVVVVTFNYRLNLMGFIAHPALDNEGHMFANYGLLDNQLALQWVHDNIAKFGGDPNNITIFGQSAGARNTASEVLSPLAKGLFKQAIFESGAIPTETPLSVAEQKGVAFAVAAGCGSGTGADVAACLRALPAAQIQTLSLSFLTGLVVDGTILPDQAIVQYETGNFNHVPILDGDARNEGAFFLAIDEFNESPQAPLTETQFQASMNTTFSGNAGPGGSPPAYPAGTVQKVLAEYPLSSYPTPELQWVQEYTDANYSCITRHVNQSISKQVPLYMYEFRYENPPVYFPPLPGFVFLAYHTSDIQFFWNVYHGGASGTPHPLNPQEEKLSEAMIRTWVNFARTGNPNGPGSAPWPRYQPNNGQILTYDITGLSTETDQFWAAEHHCDFWDQILVYQSTAQ